MKKSKVTLYYRGKGKGAASKCETFFGVVYFDIDKTGAQTDSMIIDQLEIENHESMDGKMPLKVLVDDDAFHISFTPKKITMWDFGHQIQLWIKAVHFITDTD